MNHTNRDKQSKVILKKQSGESTEKERKKHIIWDEYATIHTYNY